MVFLLASWLVLSPQQISAEKIYETSTPSIITLSIERANGTQAVGTAFLAVRKGVAVTAWHVLKGARSITAKFSDGHEAKVTGVIDKDETRDVAYLGIESEDRPVLKIAEGDPRVGSRAYVIGSPRGMDFSISDGIISQTPLFGDDKLYQFTCPVSPGNSGGPLLDAAGHVLGIVSWQLRDAQNLNFAVPGRTLGLLDESKAVVPLKGDEATNENVVAATDELIFDIFSQIDIAASSSDDGTGKSAFLFESEGTQISLFQYSKDGKSGPTVNLSMNTGYKAGTKADLEQLNSFNRAHRFVRTYRDANGVLYIENDLDLEQGVGTGRIARFISNFQETVGQFESEVLDRGSMTRADSAELKPSSEPEGVISTIDEATIAKVLKSCGYAPEKTDDSAGKKQYSFKVGETLIVLHQFTDGPTQAPTTSLTLSIGFDLQQETDLNVINLFNEQTRFAKAFVDEEGDPFLVADLGLGGGVTLESIKAFVKTFVKSIPVFAKSIGR